MQLVEQHRIDQHDPRFVAIDAAAFASKNLYNAAQYMMRQLFTRAAVLLSYEELDTIMHDEEVYRTLPAKVAQWVLKQVHQAWNSYFKAVKVWNVTPTKFLGHPRLPGYLAKHGRNVLVYTSQAISRAQEQAGWVVPSGLAIRVHTKKLHNEIAQVRIVPMPTHYVVEVIYDQVVQLADLDATLVAGIDIGVNNLATVASNTRGFVPVVVNGRPLKAINQYYNKQRAFLQTRLPNGRHTSHQLDDLADKRKRQVDNYLHVASRRIVDLLVAHRIGTLVIGKNVGWKQDVHLGQKTNQTFVFLPHARFIQMLTYKAQLVGISVILTEESHTSKCSFLDSETVSHHDHYVGKRVKRGLFVTATGKHINADVNGAYNIITKVVPDAFGKGRVGVVVHPVGLALRNWLYAA